MIKKLLLAAFMAASPLVAAHSAEAPKTSTIDMSAVMRDRNGNAMKDVSYLSSDDKTCAHCPILTLGMVAADALITPYQDEQALPYPQKWARGILAERLEKGGEQKLTAEEVTVVKTLVGKYWGPVVLVQALPLLDPNAALPSVSP